MAEYRDFLPSDKPAVAIECSNCSHCRKEFVWRCGLGDPAGIAESHGWCERFSLSKPALRRMIRLWTKKLYENSGKA